MKLYVLIQDDPMIVVGVFSTLQAAQTAWHPRPPLGTGGTYQWDGYDSDGTQRYDDRDRDWFFDAEMKDRATIELFELDERR